MLDLISQGLGQQLMPLGLTSARIDGQSSLQQRRNTLERFNSDKGCVVILATIGAVGEGYVLILVHCPLLSPSSTSGIKAKIFVQHVRIDLSVASEVHIVEPHWNPMAEAQAVDRVHRIGQTRDVRITRYCVKGSIEEASLFPPLSGYVHTNPRTTL